MHGNSQNTTTTATRPQSQTHKPQPYFIQHEFGGSSQLTTTLVHALSDVTGADVTQVESGLANYVDPDALNRLFKPDSDGTPRPNGHVSFTVWDHQVTVYHNGQIAIMPPSQIPIA
jgi:hypothetical protein